VPEVISFALVAFPSLVVIINPLMVTSVFITLTASATPEAKRAIIRKTTLIAFGVLLVFAISGTVIFKVFSITIGAFQIAGGIILFSVAVVPLAIPIVSGPGAITTVIVLSGETRALPNMAILFLAIVVAMAIVFVMLRNAARIQRFMGPSGLNITTRLMGLVLAAVAVQFIIHGVESVLPELATVMRVVPKP
jgi:multiple antibiotic resistance protein